jgi:hypothetical protein
MCHVKPVAFLRKVQVVPFCHQNQAKNLHFNGRSKRTFPLISYNPFLYFRQLNIFIIVMVSTWASSLTVCLFPPFFPAIAESKGVSASGYGFIIGDLMDFLTF